MIKLRVEWHRKCLDCGTELIVDFFDKSSDAVNCPWCGRECEEENKSAELRDFLAKAVSEIEQKANGGVPTVR